MANPISRSSCRHQELAESLLAERLREAQACDGTAGYFCGSIVETGDERIDAVAGQFRFICSSGLRQEDVDTARAAGAGLPNLQDNV